MKANQGQSGESGRLGELFESVLAIRRELRSRRAHLPLTRDRVRALEDRLRIKLLPAVEALCQGTGSETAYAYAICGSIHFELGQYREGQAAYTQANELNPGSRAILTGLSECATENGDRSAAKRAAKQITEFFPDEAKGWADLAMILCMAGETDEAIATVDHAIALDPVDVTFRMIKENCTLLRGISVSRKEKPQDN